MMVLCNPHNPIGIQWDADTLAELAAIARAVALAGEEVDSQCYAFHHARHEGKLVAGYGESVAGHYKSNLTPYSLNHITT